MSSAPLLTEAFPEAGQVGQALRQAGLTVAVAESCTGGLLGAALTATPGASLYLLGGVVAYADAVKVALLGVSEELLAAQGAVSEAVARAMADGARRLLGADIGLGVTGVAGPSGEGAGKPPGLMWVACLGPGDALTAIRNVEDAGREGNRAIAVRLALRLCRAAIEAASSPS
ncbi:MAG TPA: nicotinamide-nucleotide amidohydrolase family protein [Candidatus Dormibacteraeota bacterium]